MLNYCTPMESEYGPKEFSEFLKGKGPFSFTYSEGEERGGLLDLQGDSRRERATKENLNRLSYEQRVSIFKDNLRGHFFFFNGFFCGIFVTFARSPPRLS